MILDKAVIDAITVSSHDVELSDYWNEAVRNFSQLDASGVREAGFKGYNGHVSRDGHTAFFWRDVSGRTDYLVQLRGSTSELRFRSIGLVKPFKITRVDIAYTSSKTYPRLSTLVSGLDMLGRKMKLEVDKDGLETLYVGDRKSTKFCRFYEKPTHMGNKLRFEVELKGKYANKYGMSLIDNVSTRYAILASILDWLPLTVQGQLPFDFTYDDKAKPSGYVLEKDAPEKGLSYDLWVSNIVVPSLKKRMMLESAVADDGYDFALKYDLLIAELSLTLQHARENYARLQARSMPCCYDAPTLPDGRRVKGNPFSNGYKPIEGYD